MDNADKRKQAEKAVIWKMTCRRLQERLPTAVFEEWIRSFQLAELSENQATLWYGGTAEFMAVWEERYQALCQEAISWAAGRPLQLSIVFNTASETIEKKPKSIWKQKPAIEEKQDTEEKPATEQRHAWNSKDAEDETEALRTWGQEEKPRPKKRIGRILLKLGLLLGLLLVLVIGENAVVNRNFKEVFYQIESGKVDGRVRILQLSDLHNTEYGEGNEKLLKRAAELKPDLIVMTGDMLDRREETSETVLELCRGLAEIAPSYFIYGNSETEMSYGLENMTQGNIDELLGVTAENRDPSKLAELEDDFKVMLEATGVTLLQNSEATIQVRGTTIDIYGVLTSNPGAFWNYAGDTFGEFVRQNSGNFKLLLSHEPLLYEFYGDEYWGDLAMCGHTHGGLIRLPWIGALYRNRDKGILLPDLRRGPYYVRGRYELRNGTLIVNAGLTNRGMVRINNQPELVVVDINRY